VNGSFERHGNLNKDAVGPFAQARDAARQEENEAHADPNLRKVTVREGKRGCIVAPKLIFMRC
jgi:hypothetical protein